MVWVFGEREKVEKSNLKCSFNNFKGKIKSPIMLL